MEPGDTTAEDRTIRIGDTTIELTRAEVRLCAVSFLYRPWPGAYMERRYVTPEQVLQIFSPKDAFQVSDDGYAVMRAKAERLIALRNSAA